MVSPRSRRLDRPGTSDSQRALVTLPLPWSGHLQRGKLRRPEPPATAVSRPRLMDRIDEELRPLTLIVAPPGFGKTTAAAEWANRQPPTAWFTADADDASLPRFWAHLREALADVAPGFGELVTASLEVPHRAPADDLGRMLADELLDVPGPVRLVIDDLHLVHEGEVHDFLTGLLELAPPGFRLLVTARAEPPLPLTRLRLRGAMSELRGADLLFTKEETRELAARTGSGGAVVTTDHFAAVLWQRTGGWAAGVRLAAIAARREESGDSALDAAEAAGSRLLSVLLDETLAGRVPAEQAALVRAALPDRFDARLVAALAEADDRAAIAQAAVRFALAADLCRPSARYDGEWLEFHPLFREALRRRLEAEAPPAVLAALHAQAAAWFEAAALPDAAIAHRLATGEFAPAIALVERELQPAFAREELAAIARWLALLPDDVVRERSQLLLARAYLAHLRGQPALLRGLLESLDGRLAPGDLAPNAATIRAEMELLTLVPVVPMQIDPAGSAAIARRATELIPPDRRFPLGLAWMAVGMALQSCGRGDEAVGALTRWTEATIDRVDAASVRGLLGLLFVYAQAGELSRVESVARSTLLLAMRHRLRLSADWCRRFLGDVLYERNDLAGAIEHYAMVARDHEYFHLTGLREAFFGLALAYRAAGSAEDARRALRRARELLVEAGAIEHLPVIEADEAYLALLAGDLDRAMTWARANRPGVDDVPLYFMVHPTLIRAAILCAAGGEAALAEAIALVAELRERAARAHFAAALVRIEALAAVAHLKRGEREAAIAAIRRSLETGAPHGFTRSYLDLLPMFAHEVSELGAAVALPPVVRAALDSPVVVAARQMPPALVPAASLTDRERDVLEALAQRLTYKEIADRLFISPLTVKRHASSIYSKLGVSGRFDAVRAAREPGWQP